MSPENISGGLGKYVDNSAFVRLLSTPGRVKILDVFLRRPGTKLTASEVADAADIDPATFSRNKDILEYFGIIESESTRGSTLYQINLENPIVGTLQTAHTELMRYNPQFVEAAEMEAQDYIGKIKAYDRMQSHEDKEELDDTEKGVLEEELSA